MKPPRLALVIGSGGVRSSAALGLAQVLEEQGLRPDLLVGCSAGALFAALLASGRSAAQAQAVAATLWSAELTRVRRWRGLAQLLWPDWAGFENGFGLRDDRLVMQRLDQAFGSLCFEDLPVPLRVVAADALTGARVVLRSGPLVPALRASIALPFVFTPGLVNGRLLVDGFVADPLPVSAAADAAGVVALGCAAPMPRRINRPRRLLAQLCAAHTNHLTEARLAEARAGGMRLVHVEPALARPVGLFDVAAMPALVEAGRLAAEQQLPLLCALLAQRRLTLAA